MTPRLLTEALEAPDRIADQLAANRPAIADIVGRLKASPPRFIVTGSRGSSSHAARFAKYLIETRLGIFTAAAAPSVATLYRARMKLDGALFLSVSQSGRSPDLVVQAEAAKAAGATTLALVNDVDSPLAKASDVLMLVTPGGAETKNLVNAKVLDALGPKGFLVNISRGSVVDQPVLLKYLQEGRIAGAGLDVFADEPKVPAGFYSLDNAVLFPHVGSGTHETRFAMGMVQVDNIRALFAGKPLLTPVV